MYSTATVDNGRLRSIFAPKKYNPMEIEVFKFRPILVCLGHRSVQVTGFAGDRLDR